METNIPIEIKQTGDPAPTVGKCAGGVKVCLNSVPLASEICMNAGIGNFCRRELSANRPILEYFPRKVFD
jgi:hypothetical protein